MAYLKELASWPRVAGLVLTVGGSVLYFSRGLQPGEPLALLLLSIAVICASAFPVLARGVAREKQVDTVTLTALPLGIGGGILLLFAGLLEGIPHISFVGWGVVIGLAVVNTLVPYLLYSHALRTLHAVEANIFVSLTPLGTSLIAAVTVGERLTGIQFAALLLMIGGASLAQWRRGRR